MINPLIERLWPELEWIKDQKLKERTAATWELALSKSVLRADDLSRIPFTLMCGPDMKVSFIAHKRCVVQIARAAGERMNQFFMPELKVDLDILISGAILADVGKVLEYELDNQDKAVQGNYGKYLRHPFSGVSLAEQCGVPPEVCHIIAAHAGEGDQVKRTTEAYIVHHADFMAFEPFRSRLVI